MGNAVPIDVSTQPVVATSIFVTKVAIDISHRYLRIEPILTDADFIAGQLLSIKSEWLDQKGIVKRVENDTLKTGPLGSGESPSILWVDDEKVSWVAGWSVQFTVTCNNKISLGLRITASADAPSMPTVKPIPLNNPVAYPSKIDPIEQTTSSTTTIAPKVQLANPVV